MSEGQTQPTDEAMTKFTALPDNEMIHMINFLSFRETADYPVGHEHADKGWTGRRAYEEYIKLLGPIFQRIGARVVWRGAFQSTLIGSPEEHWDDILIAEYPDSKVFMEMVFSDAEYQAVGVNRMAALSDTRLIRTEPEA